MVEPALNGEPRGPAAMLARALAAGGTFGVRFARFAEALAPAAGAELLAACWLDLEGQSVRALATWPDPGGAGREFPIASLELEQLAVAADVGFAPGDLAGHPGADFLRELGIRQAWVAALSEDGKPVGLLVAGRASERPFAAHEQEALREGAGLLAPAVAAERQLEAARRAVQRARVLNELAVLVNRGEGPEAFFAALSRHLREVLDFDGLGLWVTEGTEHFRVVGTLKGRTTRVGQVEPREAMGNVLDLLSGKGAVEAPIDVFSGRVVDRARAIGAKRGAAVALRAEGELVGLLLMSRMSDRPFDAEEVEHLETVGALVGQAIGNVRKVEQRLAEAIRREALSELTALLRGEGTLEERFEAFSQTLLQAVGFDHISVTLCDAETGEWRPIRSHRLDIDDDPRFDPSGIEAVVRAGGVHQYRTAASGRRVPQALARAGFRRAATAAMTSAAGNEGLLTIGRAADDPFGEEDLGFIRVAAALLGQAVAAQREQVRERREAEDQAVLTAAAAAVARELDGFAIQLALTEVLRQVVPAPYVAFGFLDGGRVVFPNVAGAPGVAPLEAHFARALAEGQAVVGRPGERAPGEGCEELDALGVQAYVVTAASSSGAPVGFLVIGSRDPAFEPGERLQRLAQLIADIAGPAMANWRAAERERQEAEEQRLIAEVAAVAAREASPDGMLVALQRPLRRLVPLPMVAFGFKEGERVLYPLGDGQLFEVKVDRYAAAAEAEGQTWADDLPADLDPLSPLWTMGVHAISTTVVRSGGQTVGYLLVGSRESDYSFGEGELRLFRLLAQIVGPAMLNARAAQRTREDAEEQRFLAEAARIAAAAADEQELVRGLARHIRQLVPASRFDLLLRRPNGDLKSVARPGMVFPFDANLARVSSEGQAVLPPTNPDENPASRARMLELGIVTYVSTRLVAGGQEIGTLWVGSSDPDYQPTERHLRIFRMVADLAGPALASLLELRRRAEEAEEQRFLADCAGAAARARTGADFLRGLTETFQGLVPGAIVGFFYIDGDEGTDAATGHIMPVGPGLRRAIAARQSIDDLETSDILPENRERIAAAGLRSWVTTTAESEGELIGALVVGTPAGPEVLGERVLRLCRLVADIAGPAMATFRERRRRLEEAEDERVVAQVAAAAAAARSLAEVVDALPAALGERIPGAFALYGFVRGDAIAYQVTPAEARALHPGEELVMPFSPVGRAALTTGQGVGNLQRGGDWAFAPLGLQRYSLTSYHSAGGVSGMLMVASRDPQYRFGARELALLRRVTGVVGPVVEVLHAQAERDRHAEEQRLLAEVLTATAAGSSAPEMLAGISRVLSELVPTAFAAYGKLDGDVLRWPHVLGGEFRLSVLPHEAEACERGQTVVDGSAIPETHFGPQLGLTAACYTATYAGGQPAGLLLVASRTAGFAFSEWLLGLLRRVAQAVGPALEAAMANREREHQAEMYGLILRSLSEGVILADREGRPAFANRLGRKILAAIDPRPASGTLEEMVARLPEPVRSDYERVYRQRESVRGQARLAVDGEVRVFDYEMVPLSDPQLRALVVAEDVTERVRREAEEAANRARMEQTSRLAALGELIGGVAHELNNPLTAILGFAEVLAMGDTTGAFGEELSIIQKEALRARNIVRDLLFIARPGAAEHGPVAIEEVVGHVQRLRERHWQQQAIEVQVSLAPGLTAWGNEHQLTQVLLNLVTNAEHALAGRPTRRLVIEGEPGGDGRVRLTVSDTGHGMDEATRARIFEPFFTTKQGAGTGLGLSLSYSIVQSHRGTIDCISKPGAGTTFVITLPAEGQAPPSEAEAEIVPAGRQLTVLVIDDEPSLRKVCRRLVESLGHRCLDAENSAAALDLAAEHEPDIILCDYRLAAETADAVFAKLEAELPHLLERVVLATGATSDAGVAGLTERFGVRLLAKPYGLEDLECLVRERLEEVEGGGRR